jgi:nucleotide-binding universal stress UspA family protein
MTQAISRILVPVDFSAHSEDALRYAVSLAGRLGASLELLHVVEDPFLSGAWSSELYLPNGAELLDSIVSDAKRRLSDLKDLIVQGRVPASTVVLKGPPAPTIIDHAKDGQFDLVVMGTHGRTGLAHLFMGSVAEAVARRAPCPVLTIRQAPRPAEQPGPASATAAA